MSLRVVYENPNEIYRPGETVKGTIILQVNKEIKASSLSIIINGVASTFELVPEGKYRVPYRSEIVYVSGEMEVWKGQGGLPLGSHEFPFCFVLPINCPPSFEGGDTYIRYSVDCLLDLPFKFGKYNSVFTVSPVLDLSLLRWSSRRVLGSKTQQTHYFSRKNHFLFQGSLPKMGYVPGEIVEAEIKATNNTSMFVQKVRVEIVQLVHQIGYKWNPDKNSSTLHKEGSNGRKTVLEFITSYNQHVVSLEPGESCNLPLSIEVPPVVPSFNICPIINIEYSFRAVFCCEGPFSFSSNQNPHFDLPILIGTIPIRPPSHDSVARSLMVSHLPSYRQCVQSPSTSQQSNQDNTFLPQCAVYPTMSRPSTGNVVEKQGKY